MPSDPTFASVKFEEPGRRGKIDIAWMTPDIVSVFVDLNTGRAPMAQYWRVEAGSAAELQALLPRTALELPHSTRQFVMEVMPVGAAPLRFEWDLRREPTTLRAVRLHLEQLAHIRASEATAALHESETLGGEGKLEAAVSILRFGIEALGDLYVSPNLIDDTDAKRLLADHSFQTGKLAQATALYQRVLESRITEYLNRVNAK